MNVERWTPEYYDGVDYVVVSKTGRYGQDELREYIEFLNGLGLRKIIVLGNFIHLREDLLVALPKYESLRSLVAAYFSGMTFRNNAELSKVCQEKGCLFVDKQSILCNDEGCILEVGGIPFTWDRGHLTWAFATLIRRKAQAAILTYLDESFEKPAGNFGIESTSRRR